MPVSLGRLALLPLLGILLNAFMLSQLDWQVVAIGLALTASGAAAAVANRRWRARRGCQNND